MDEDYDIYGGASWSAYHDDVDPYEAEWERRAEEQAHLKAEAYAEDQYLIDKYDPEWQRQDETLHGLGDFDAGEDQ
jgi:hypothetical protein